MSDMLKACTFCGIVRYRPKRVRSLCVAAIERREHKGLTPNGVIMATWTRTGHAKADADRAKRLEVPKW